MNDDTTMLGGLFFSILAVLGVFFLLGSRFGYSDGIVDGKNEGIVLCMIISNLTKNLEKIND